MKRSKRIWVKIDGYISQFNSYRDADYNRYIKFEGEWHMVSKQWNLDYWLLTGILE